MDKLTKEQEHEWDLFDKERSYEEDQYVQWLEQQKKTIKNKLEWEEFHELE